MLSILATEAPKAAGSGAPIWQIALVAGATTVTTLFALWLIVAFRAGRARPLRRAALFVGRITKVPGWASLPALLALVAVVIALFGAEWDIALHIDEGRDDGPLGTAAHYPILIGLMLFFVAGLLAVGMAPKEGPQSSRAAIRIKGLWPVPVSAALILAGSSMAFLAFPLDDLWHRVFGQDVTLWGPTHIMLIACAITGALGIVLLMVEGALAAGHDPRKARGVLLRMIPLPVLFGVIVLAGFTLEMDEFNFGVPQFRLVWHPILIAVAASLGLVVARLWGGPGAALKAAVLAFLAFVPLTLLVHFVFGQSFHAQPLYIVEALAIELLAIRGAWRRPLLFGAVSGLLVGTIGFASEYGWTQIAFRLPWTTNLLPEGVPLAIVAGVAGGVLGALLAEAISGRLRPGRKPVAIAAVAGVVLIAVGLRALEHHAPQGATATITVTDIRNEDTPGKGRVEATGNVQVRFHGPDVTKDADWVRAMGWQGHGAFSNIFEQQADGSWRSTARVPLGGRWRTILSVNGRGTVLGVPLYMPADPPVDFAGFPLKAEITRDVVSLESLAQIERKQDAPAWAWKPATLAVLLINLLLLIGLGATVYRIGRATPNADEAAVGEGRATPTVGDGPDGTPTREPEPVRS